jgi:hypothetical protein
MPYHSIGKPGSPALEHFRKHGLAPFRELLSPELFAAVWPVPAHRNAVLVPEVVFWLMVTSALGDGAMCGAIASFWTTVAAVFPTLRQKSVTEEAFCMARRRLSLHFFKSLFDTFVQRQAQAQAQRWLWHGLRLLGIDGTELRLTANEALRKAYPTQPHKRGAAKYPQALLVGLVGLCSGICQRFVLAPVKRGEQWCACWLTRYLQPDDLLLGDRNFANSEIMARIKHQHANFLFRLPAKRYHKLPRHATNSRRQDEWLVELRLPAALRKRCPFLPAVITVRILEYQIPGYRVSWLITSLTDAQAYPYDEIVRLYHLRWNQETLHNEWKHTLQLSNLRSHSSEGILKEVFTQLTLNNALRAMQAEALPADQTPMSLRFRDTKRIVVGVIAHMAFSPLEMLPAIYAELLRVLAGLKILVRPGRWYPRKNEGKLKSKGHGKFVLPARLPVPLEPALASV